MSTASPSLHLVVAGPASHSPALLEEMRGLAARLGEALGAAAVAAAWFDQGRPALGDALVAAAAQGATTILVVPALLQWSYPDQFSLPDQVLAFARRHPAVQVHLAAPAGLVAAVEDELLAHARAALAGDGLAAVSPAALREATFRDPPAARTETAPSHAALRHHLLVCGGRPCLDAGATLLEAELRAAVGAAGLTNGAERVQVTRTRCLGPCRGAAVVAAYPAGEWYHGVAAEQAAALLETATGASDALAPQRFRPGAGEGR